MLLETFITFLKQLIQKIILKVNEDVYSLSDQENELFPCEKKHQLQIQPDVEMSPESVRQYLGVNMHSGECHL